MKKLITLLLAASLFGCNSGSDAVVEPEVEPTGYVFFQNIASYIAIEKDQYGEDFILYYNAFQFNCIEGTIFKLEVSGQVAYLSEYSYWYVNGEPVECKRPIKFIDTEIFVEAQTTGLLQVDWETW